jgi:hypothetical protein
VSTGTFRRALAACGAAVLLVFLSACGGGGGSDNGSADTGSLTLRANGPVALPTDGPLAANAVTMVVDEGTDGSAVNTPFVTVTVCVPGSSTCQTIDHVMVDTGSYGLRVAASALGAATALPAVAAPDGEPLAECAGFVSGFAWGPVRTADVRIGGETALGVPIQVVNDSAAPFVTVPTDCSNTGPAMGVGPGAKGILGVGFRKQDCGAACASSAAPSVYFSCPATGCASTAAPLASQVTNPVALFATDNNGVALALPDVPFGGVPSATGLLIFGVGTAANNQLGSAQVFTANAAGNFTTVYQGRTLTAFLDSGSNGIFVQDTAVPSCSNGFYCPASTLSLTATVTGANGTSQEVPFAVESARSLPASTAAAHLAGDIGSSRSLDWGLPFFFGRKVFVALQGASTPFGTGPYWGF